MFTPAEMEQFLHDAFPGSPPPYRVELVGADQVRLRMPAEATTVRPGGTISGPTLMALTDTVAWVAVLARIGPVALSVTSHLSIHFLRKPPPGDLVGVGEVLRLGRRQGVVDVRLTGVGSDDLVAVATVTYAIPSGD